MSKKNSRNRQPERQALKGARVKTALRGDRWAHRSDQPPLLDEASTRYPKKKGGKKAPPKEHCRANPHGHTHEWMKDKEPIPIVEHYWVEGRLAHFNRDEYKMKWYKGPVMKTRQVGTKPVLFKLCAHCGKTLYKRGGRSRYGGKWSERSPGYYTRYKSWNGRTVIR